MMNEQALQDRLKTIARERGVQPKACWKQLVLERFLARLSHSSHTSKFIFKGGFLLAYMMKIGRETIDLDFLINSTKADEKTLEKLISEISLIHLEDGFTFTFSKIEILSQPHMEYLGYRITIEAMFGKVRDRIHIDIGVGDGVQPQRRDIKLLQYRGKPIFEESASVLSYPLETIFAEKLETVISKGASNSRIKEEC